MSDSLLNPIQSEEVGVRVDLRPKLYYPYVVGFQLLHFPDGKNIPVLYEGAVPYISFRYPKKKMMFTTVDSYKQSPQYLVFHSFSMDFFRYPLDLNKLI